MSGLEQPSHHSSRGRPGRPHSSDISLPRGEFNPPRSGLLSGWFETGTEGTVWTVQEPGKGYDGMHILEAGDFLQVKDPGGKVIFEGVIDPDRDKNWEPHWPGASHGQPLVRGVWVHWTQRGWTPEDWADLFMRDDHSGVIFKKKFG